MRVGIVLQEEEERMRKEEEERKEQEEYMRRKESFTVEEEGLDAKDDETQVKHILALSHTLTSCLPPMQARGVRDFIEYIQV